MAGIGFELKKLFEKKGLIIKEGGTANSYRAKNILTEEGLAAAKKLRERAEIVTNCVSGTLSQERRKILYETLELIASNMREICSDKN